CMHEVRRMRSRRTTVLGSRQVRGALRRPRGGLGRPGGVPRRPGGAHRSRYLHAAGALSALTPLHRSSFLIQPALTTTSRLSRVMGTGVSSRDCNSTFFSPPFHFDAFSTGLPAAHSTAAPAASLPRPRESLPTRHVCVP